MGKKYPAKKYVNVGVIVTGVALFMYSGSGAGKDGRGTGEQVRTIAGDKSEPEPEDRFI